jgi:pimeloyl-ACP methyl ester carboxylesterase
VAELGAIISDLDPDGMRVIIRALADADLRDAVARITVTTLPIWGEQDVRSRCGWLKISMHGSLDLGWW